MDFDDKRYYDLREIKQIYHQYNDLPEQESLPSDSTKRHDLILLASSNAIEPAQNAKEDIELLQRKDRKCREAVNDRR